jgi:DNA topoisomerase-3
LVKPLLQKPLTTTKRFVDDSKVSDHHALIPTGQPLQLTVLNAEERNLYDLIARRFIAVLYPPYRYDQITLTTVVQGEHFYSRGKIVKDPGWKAVAVKLAETEEIMEEALPEQTLTRQQKGDQKPVKSCKINKSKTKPPARYTEATLLTAMESPGKLIDDEELREAIKQSGLGTPATRAEIIEKLLSTNYIERHGKELVPTSKGLQLIKLVAPALKTPGLTAQWEQHLANIARGKGSPVDFMANIRQNTIELVKSIITDTTTVYKADNVSKTKCPGCGKFMLLVNGKRGKMLVCQDRACGYRQPEKQDDSGYRSSKSSGRINQKIIARYSDQGALGNNLGELLKAALGKENPPEDKS